MKPVLPEVPTGYARPIDVSTVMALPGVLVCIECGSLVVQVQRHSAWHWVTRSTWAQTLHNGDPANQE